MTPSDPIPALTEGDRVSVLLAYRYWLVTAGVLKRWLWRDSSPDAIRKSLSRSAERGWLARHPLDDREPYYVLGPTALSALGLRRPTKALGRDALLERYAVLLACARRECDVLTEDEFRSQFPELSQPGLSAKNYFHDTSTEPARLGCFVVDHDKSSSRMANKLGRHIARVLASDRPAFRQQVLGGGFAIHVLTATEGKRANIEAALARKKPRNVPVFVEAHPELECLFLVNRR